MAPRVRACTGRLRAQRTGAFAGHRRAGRVLQARTHILDKRAPDGISTRDLLCTPQFPPQHHASNLTQRTVSQHTIPHAALSWWNCLTHLCTLALPPLYLPVCVYEHRYFYASIPTARAARIAHNLVSQHITPFPTFSIRPGFTLHTSCTIFLC